jgi:hypothetical protein
MNIEIVDFFPNTVQKQKNKICGTMHVYLADLEVDIRGICVHFTLNGSLFIGMPGAFGIDQETGKKVRYPTFSFTSQQKRKELMQTIKIKAREYIQKNLFKSKPVQKQNEKLKTKEKTKELIKT